ncbi:unnamed protein product [Soboliphyme baturini]|uniref:Sodium-bile acid cotransporter n=1 Tax=Soboliphyme baturini TaxID=241478 RepID=A0A183IDF9_9BILA|nr:unnamed protein product [Soboliphyme baturini]
MRYNGRCPFLNLVQILIAIFSSLASFVCAGVNAAWTDVSFDPPYSKKLREGDNASFAVVFRYDASPSSSLSLMRNSSKCAGRPRMVKMLSQNPEVADLADAPMRCSHFRFKQAATSTNADAKADDIDAEKERMDRWMCWSLDTNHTSDNDGSVFNVTVSIEGKFLGRALLSVIIECDRNHTLRRTYDVSVLRRNRRLGHIFVGVLTLLLIFANLLMATEVHLEVVWEVIKRPLAPAIGLFCQYFAMPMLSYGIAQLLFVPVGLYSLSLGIFTSGCSPGGGASNAYVVLFDGNVDLSVTMTFISTLLSLAMMPFWMYLLGKQFLVHQAAHDIIIPYKNIAYSLMIFIGPLGIGVLLWRYKPSWGALRPFLLLIILFIMSFGIYANLYMFKLMTWRVLIAGLTLPLSGFVFGLLLSMIMKQPYRNIVAISLETGIQNTGIAIMLLQVLFS